MKKLILLFAILGTSCGSVKYYNSPISPRTEIVELTTDKNTNFVNANEWMVEVFNNAESVIQFSDKEAGIVKGKYIVFSGSQGRVVHYGYGITNTVGRLTRPFCYNHCKG